MRSATWLSLPLVLTWAVLPEETYVGTAVCVGCHERHGRWLAGSVHEKAPVKEGDEPGCEACHGAGSRHLESPATDTIINFRVEEAAARSARCLRCHAGKHARGHAPDQVACNDCHARRNSEGFHGLRAGTAAALIPPAVCLRCHLRLPASHDAKQGAIRAVCGVTAVSTGRIRSGGCARMQVAVEKLMAKGYVYINVERCKGCAFCVEFCPTKVLALSSAFNSRGYHPPHVVVAEKCSGCDLCGMYCPDFAIFGWKVSEPKPPAAVAAQEAEHAG